MKIYLAGSVPKGDEKARTFKNWRIKYLQVLQNMFENIEVIDPYDRPIDEEDCLLVVGSDCQQIKSADLVIVNAQEKLGAGTAMELVIAKYLKKPVVSILPKDSHHRRPDVVFHGKLVKDWIHPFIFTFSDHVLEDLKEIGKIKLTKKPKNSSIIDEAIAYFEEAN